MTKPRYQTGCAARSKDHGEAAVPGNPGYFRVVNFDNGNVNNNHGDNNRFFARPVRVGGLPAGEYQGDTPRGDRRGFNKAWKRARRRKKPSVNQLRFEARWIDALPNLADRVAAEIWSPSPTVCFIAQRPKAREIHAPDFGDRVVHHWLVPQLEAIYEPTFIYDSFSNRPGKGVHAAVDRLQVFSRQVHSGQGGGWYLQLDIRNFFNRIHRPTLYRMLKRRMERAGLPPATRRVAHELLRRSILEGEVTYRCTPAERARVPYEKRLENAPRGCGIAIGNLSSQFFANVYLDALDQFVKHVLKVPRYLRYVDDFVLVHESREQLIAWQAEIERFLADELRLDLKGEVKLKPLDSGIDFLGYIVHPHHRLVRPRVVHHAKEALATWEREYVRGDAIEATPEALRRVQSTWASYEGHFHHANAWRLQQGLQRRFPWLPAATRRRRFDSSLEGQTLKVRA